MQTGSCHCGTVRFEVDSGIEEYRRCNCSICRRKGAVMVTAKKEDFRIVAGGANLSLYQWNTNTARHYFCKTCGIYTHHWRRSAPQYGYNLGCIDGIDIEDYTEIPMRNGKSMSLDDPFMSLDYQLMSKAPRHSSRDQCRGPPSGASTHASAITLFIDH